LPCSLRHTEAWSTDSALPPFFWLWNQVSFSCCSFLLFIALFPSFFNMLSLVRRRFLDGLDTRYIYGRVVCICFYVSPHYGGLEQPITSSTPFHKTLEVNILTIPPAYYLQPLLHAILFLIEMVIAAQLAAKF